MDILVNTDTNIDLDAETVGRIQADLAAELDRFGRRLTRIEVHLRDESAGRETLDDIRCLMEARPAGQDPVVVTHHADSVDTALGGATAKLDALLTSFFDRRRATRGRDTIRGR